MHNHQDFPSGRNGLLLQFTDDCVEMGIVERNQVSAYHVLDKDEAKALKEKLDQFLEPGEGDFHFIPIH